MRWLALLFLTLCAVSSANAQERAVPDSTCTYDTCALRLEPWGQIVRGREGIPVARLGLMGPDLVPLVQGSPEAVRYAHQFNRAYGRSQVAMLGAAGLLVVGRLPQVSVGVSVGASLVGLGLSIYSIPLGPRWQRGLSRAMWEYNRTLLR